MGKRVALLMGMTAYRDDRLEAPASLRDMRLLVELLRDDDAGRFDRVVPLFNQTAVELQLGIASFLEKELEPDDLILVYFGGHCLVHHQSLYLAATDTFTEEYLDATTVDVEFIHRRLQTCPARQVILFDCRISLLGATPRHANGREMLAALFTADNRALLVGDGVTAALAAGLQDGTAGDAQGAVTAASWFAFAGEQAAAETLLTAVGEGLDAIPLVVRRGAGAAAVPIPPAPPPAKTTAEPSPKWRRYGFAVLLLLLLLAAGFYAMNRGVFTTSGKGAAEPTAVPAQAALPTNTPTPTDEPEATETAVPPTPSLTATAEKTMIATETAVPATPSPAETLSPTPTNTATATPSDTPSPTPTPEPVPMDVVAQQAFLRAGPGINYRILAFPARGTAVTVIARNGDATWFNVILADGESGWLYQEVIAPEDDADFAGVPIAATIPAPINDFFDSVVVPAEDGLAAQVYHTYVGTFGDDAYFQATLRPETELVQPTYPRGQELGIGLLTAVFNRAADGAYTSNQVEFCMVSADGTPFYCETFPARKSW